MEEKLNWQDEAEDRLMRVPEGFMRTMTRKRIEEHAVQNGITDITLQTAEFVIESSRAGMGSMMSGDASEMPPHVMAKTSYFFCFVCNYAVKDEKPGICPNCRSDGEKFSILKEECRTEAHTIMLKWSQNALTGLKNIPNDFQRKMTRWEIEAFSRRKNYKVITRDVMDERYSVWSSISGKIESKMEWGKEAEERVRKIPEPIRGMVIKEMELHAQKKGEAIVTTDTLESIRDKWQKTGEFHVKWQED